MWKGTHANNGLTKGRLHSFGRMKQGVVLWGGLLAGNFNWTLASNTLNGPVQSEVKCVGSLDGEGKLAAWRESFVWIPE